MSSCVCVCTYRYRRTVPLHRPCFACDVRVPDQLADFMTLQGCGHFACHSHLPSLASHACPTCHLTLSALFGATEHNVCQICFEVVAADIAIPDAWYGRRVIHDSLCLLHALAIHIHHATMHSRFIWSSSLPPPHSYTASTHFARRVWKA
jgi:hypothetical protein